MRIFTSNSTAAPDRVIWELWIDRFSKVQPCRTALFFPDTGAIRVVQKRAFVFGKVLHEPQWEETGVPVWGY